MKKGKQKQPKHHKRSVVSNKIIMLVLALVLMAGGVVGGSLAWLLDDTDTITNTFTDSDIEITLTESGDDVDSNTEGEQRNYKMIPGWTIDKDPVVTVKEGSEDCWVFIEVEKTSNLDDFITYEIDSSNWTLLEGKDSVYCCKVKDITTDRQIKVLGYTDAVTGEFQPNKVLVKDTVTKEMMDAIDGVVADETTNSDAAKAEIAARPRLSFKAYAVQLMKNVDTEFSSDDAWKEAKKLEQTTP